MKRKTRGCIYMFPGLGATSAMFKKYEFAEFDVQRIDWQAPIKKETFSDYAARYLSFIDKSRPAIFLGVSFGGIIANELARFHKPALLILISTVESSSSIPMKFRIGQIFPVSLIPGKFIKRCIPLIEWTFRIKSDENKKLFREMTRDVPNAFFPWAVFGVSCWKGLSQNYQETLTIHGSRDLIFPMSKTECDYLIEGAGHFMAVDESEMINQIIEKELERRLL